MESTNKVVANALAVNDKKNALELVKEYKRDCAKKIGELRDDASTYYDLLLSYGKKFRDNAKAESNTDAYKEIELVASDLLPDFKRIVDSLNILYQAARS